MDEDIVEVPENEIVTSGNFGTNRFWLFYHKREYTKPELTD